MGSLLISLVQLSKYHGPSIHGRWSGQSVFKYLRDCLLVFSETLHEVRGHESKESDAARILEKNLNLGIKGD